MDAVGLVGIEKRLGVAVVDRHTLTKYIACIPVYFFYFFTKALVFNRGEKKVKRALIQYSSTIIFEEWRHQGEIQQYFKVTRSSLNCSTVLVSGV